MHLQQMTIENCDDDYGKGRNCSFIMNKFFLLLSQCFQLYLLSIITFIYNFPYFTPRGFQSSAADFAKGQPFPTYIKSAADDF